MGLAGALAPRLAVGDWVVGTLSPTGMERREWSVGAGATRPPGERRTDPQPTARKEASSGWISRIAALLPGAVVGRIHADGSMIVTAAQKEELHFSQRALACDMESHIAARVAARHGLPFAVARVISDCADRTLPRAAQVAMAPDGGIRIGALLLAILIRPWQTPRADRRRSRRRSRDEGASPRLRRACSSRVWSWRSAPARARHGLRRRRRPGAPG